MPPGNCSGNTDSQTGDNPISFLIIVVPRRTGALPFGPTRRCGGSALSCLFDSRLPDKCRAKEIKGGLGSPRRYREKHPFLDSRHTKTTSKSFATLWQMP